MTWDADTPYDGLPLLPPAPELESRAVLKATIAARSALAELDARSRVLANPAMLVGTIPMLEARASSEIENIVTTTDELFVAAAMDDGTPATREALRYRRALSTGLARLERRPLTAATAVEVCAEIRGHDEGVRSGEVYIGDPTTRRRIYTPPRGRAALDLLLDNWSEYLNTPDDVDPLVRMSVAHYQFEAIHPFSDGNGRTGRIMNVLMLCDSGLLRLPLLYLSRHIIQSKDDYYRLLLGVTRDGAWEPWLLYMLEGVRATSIWTLGLVEQIEEVNHQMVETLRAALGVVNHDLVALLMEQPYARSADVMARCGVSRPTALKWLRALIDAGFTSELQIGRNVLYVNRPLLKVLIAS